MLRGMVLSAGLLGFALVGPPAVGAPDGAPGGTIRATITKVDPPPATTKDQDLAGTLFVEWTPAKPGNLDRGFVAIDRKRTNLTLNGQPARFGQLGVGMRVEFVAQQALLTDPPVYIADEVHAFTR